MSTTSKTGKNSSDESKSTNIKSPLVSSTINLNGEDKYKNLSNTNRVWTSLIAGALAGSLAKTTIAPLDRTKIYFQTSSTEKFSSRAALLYLVKTFKQTGFISLWRGNSATMARIMPYAAIQFTSHEQWKRALGVDMGSDDNQNYFLKFTMFNAEVSRFLAGSMAGVTAQSLTYPLDMTRARLAVSSKSKYRSLAHAFSRIYREEGLMTLYRGYSATLLGVIPYTGTSFYIYESLKRKWIKDFTVPGQELSPLISLCCGALAGILGQTSSYPLDIVRRRLQVSSSNELSRVDDKGRTKRIGILSMMLTIAKKEGIANGLFKGLSMNWLKGPVAAGISFTTFDLTKNFLRSQCCSNV